MHHWSTASVRCISALLPSIQIHRAVSTTQNSMLVALPISVTAVEVSNSVKYTNQTLTVPVGEQSVRCDNWFDEQAAY